MRVAPERRSAECGWAYLSQITASALSLAPSTYLDDIRANLAADGLPVAVADRDTASIFNHLLGVAQMQGISDANAAAFVARNGLVTWEDIDIALEADQACPRLRSYWAFSGCGYRKGTGTCAEPLHIRSCSLPTHPTRKGSLIVAAYSLAQFLRDICAGDFVGWIDRRLADADPGIGAAYRAERMGWALLEPLREVYGLGAKVWSMALADLLMAADPNRERWITTGAGMVVIDSLLHNHLHRTGVLRRFEAEHLYGPRCYGSGGCFDIMRGLAERFDARTINPAFPACFPRLVQFAVWRFCSTSELDICNGNRIDDWQRCGNATCPVFTRCDRIALHA